MEELLPQSVVDYLKTQDNIKFDINLYHSLMEKYETENAVILHLGEDKTSYDNNLFAGILKMKQYTRSNIDYITLVNENTIYDLSYFLDNLEELEEFISKYDYINYLRTHSCVSRFLQLYSIHVDEEPVESYNQALMRIAIGYYSTKGIEAVKYAFKQLIKGKYTPATPQYFNACSRKPQLSSCFKLVIDDTMVSIAIEDAKTCLISGEGGGVAIFFSHLRHSQIKSGGKSNGVIPIIQKYNKTFRFANQKGKRDGAGAAALCAWHIDVLEFFELCNTISDNFVDKMKLILIFPDLLIKRAKEDKNWTLMCPNHSLGLNDVYGNEFEEMYKMYENTIDDQYKKIISARDFLIKYLATWLSFRTPFPMFRDTCCSRSNHRHFGVIDMTNICTEILLNTNKFGVAICNLQSINSGIFIKETPDHRITTLEELQRYYNFNKYGETVRHMINNLNITIDINYDPLTKTHYNNITNSNQFFRAVGLGECGRFDAYIKLNMIYSQFKQLNYMTPEEELSELFGEMLSACKYFNALFQSIQLAIYDGPCLAHEESLASQGILQFDLWGEDPLPTHFWCQNPLNLLDNEDNILTTIQTWRDIKEAIMTYGLRNSMLIASPPLATSSEMLPEMPTTPGTSVPYGIQYYKNTLNGTMLMSNREFYYRMKRRGLFTKEVTKFIYENNGSIQGLSDYLDLSHSDYEYVKDLEKMFITVYDFSQRKLIDRLATNGKYTCQAESCNVYLNINDHESLVEDLIDLFYYAHNKGIKTLYYMNLNKEEGFKYHSKLSKKPKKKVFNTCTSDDCISCDS